MTDVLASPGLHRSGKAPHRPDAGWLRSASEVRPVADSRINDSIYLHRRLAEPGTQLADLAAQLQNLVLLAPNWDGAGALAVSLESVEMAASLIPLVAGWPARAQLVPTRLGGIAIEVHTLRGDLSIELCANGETEMFLTDVVRGLEVEGPLRRMLEKHSQVVAEIIRA